MSEKEENPSKQSLKNILLEFQTGSIQDQVHHSNSCIDIAASVFSKTNVHSIKRSQSAPSSISGCLAESVDGQSQSKDPQKKNISAKKSSYDKIKMEDIFGERKVFIDGEELIEVVDTYPKGPAYFCCNVSEINKGCHKNIFKGYSIKDDNKSPIAIKLVQFKSVRTFVKNKEFGIIPLEVHTMKKIQGHSAAVKFLHYQPLSEEQFAIITERSKHCADLYEMTCDGKLPFTEGSARTVIHQMASVLRALEKKNIIHQDVRTDNIVYDFDSGDAKLLDFAMARKVRPWQKLKKHTGNRINWPPEYVKQKSFDPHKATSWALGTVVFELLNGVPPYAGVTHAVNGRLKFFENVSYDCEDLIRGLLRLDPSKRYSLKKVLKHPWVTGEESRSIFRIPSFIRRIFKQP